MKKVFNFGVIRFWMLPANSRTRDVAGHFMQVQSNLQTLLAGHLAVAFNLFVQCRCRSHEANIAKLLQRSKIIQPGVGAMQSRLRRVVNHKLKTTLNGLHPRAWNGDATRSGLMFLWRLPRVATQPWAKGWNPVGIQDKLARCCPNSIAREKSGIVSF